MLNPPEEPPLGMKNIPNARCPSQPLRGPIKGRGGLYCDWLESGLQMLAENNVGLPLNFGERRNQRRFDRVRRAGAGGCNALRESCNSSYSHLRSALSGGQSRRFGG
jgi:hypothetical protein